MTPSAEGQPAPAAIVLNFRNAELTAKCVASLVPQVAEVVVVDNSESDPEADLLSSLLLPLRERVPVIVVKSPVNSGFGQGVDHGIRHLTGNPASILIFNNDAIAHPDMVAAMQHALAAHGNRAIVSARSTGKTPSRLWYHRVLGLVLFRAFPGAFPYFSGACLLLPKALAEPALFDPDFFMYGEDVELCWRMSKRGVPLVMSEGEFEHAGSASSGMRTLFYEYCVVKGHFLLAKKLSRGFADRCLLVSARCFTMLARAVLRSIRSRSIIPLRALALALFADPEPRTLIDGQGPARN